MRVLILTLLLLVLGCSRYPDSTNQADAPSNVNAADDQQHSHSEPVAPVSIDTATIEPATDDTPPEPVTVASLLPTDLEAGTLQTDSTGYVKTYPSGERIVLYIRGDRSQCDLNVFNDSRQKSVVHITINAELEYATATVYDSRSQKDIRLRFTWFAPDQFATSGDWSMIADPKTLQSLCKRTYDEFMQVM